MALMIPVRSHWRRWWLAGLLALLTLFPSPSPAQTPAPGKPAASQGRPLPPTWGFGERAAVRQCLRFRVSDYRDRQSDVDNHDWVKLRVENACPATLRNLLVELLLVDAQGNRYGAPVWVVGKGEQLQPGGTWEEDVAVPDPDSRVGRRWAVTVLRADGLPRPVKTGEKGEKKDGKK